MNVITDSATVLFVHVLAEAVLGRVSLDGSSKTFEIIHLNPIISMKPISGFCQRAPTSNSSGSRTTLVCHARMICVDKNYTDIDCGYIKAT